MEPDDENTFKEKATTTDYLRHAKKSGQLLMWLWKDVINNTARYNIRRFYVVSVFSRIVSLGFPLLMGLFVDALARKDATYLIIGVVGTLAIYIISTLLEWDMGSRIEHTLGENDASLEYLANTLFFAKNPGLHISENSKLTQANMEKGLHQFHALQSTMFFGGMDSFNTLWITWALLMFVEPVSGTIVLAALCVNAWMSLVLNKMVMSAMAPIDAELRQYKRRRNEAWEHVERVLTTDNGWREVSEMNDRYLAILKKDRVVWERYIKFTILRHMINGVTVTLVMAYVGWEGLHGRMSVTLAIPVITWASMASQQVRFLARAEREMNYAAPSVQSMRDALLIPPTIVECEDAVDLETNQPVHIQFDDVGHVYGTGDKARAVLHHVSFHIAPGEKVALIGSSGAGKSTTTQLIQRYNDPTFGAIRVNGIDLRNVSLRSWRRLIGYIAQRPQVFSGTIRDNLTYGLTTEERARITDEEILAVMATLQIDFGSRLVDGLDTRVGRNGMKLSGGEAQRLLIAAAAMKHPWFWVIDEATSSLDAESQAAVQGGIDLLLKGRASAMIIAHRLSTILGCTKFVVLRPMSEVKPGESQIEAIAHSVEELWRISPTFRKLAELEGVKIAA